MYGVWPALALASPLRESEHSGDHGDTLHRFADAGALAVLAVGGESTRIGGVAAQNTLRRAADVVAFTVSDDGIAAVHRPKVLRAGPARLPTGLEPCSLATSRLGRMGVGDWCKG
jgi:hypothetical protein